MVSASIAFLTQAITIRDPCDVSKGVARSTRAHELDHGALSLPHHNHVKVIQERRRITRRERATCHEQLRARAQMLCEQNTLFSHCDHTVNPNHFCVGTRRLFKRCFPRHKSAIQNFHIVSGVLQTCGNVTDPQWGETKYRPTVLGFEIRINEENTRHVASRIATS